MVVPYTTKFKCNACGWEKTATLGCTDHLDKFRKCPICDSHDCGYDNDLPSTFSGGASEENKRSVLSRIFKRKKRW